MSSSDLSVQENLAEFIHDCHEADDSEEKHLECVKSR